MTDRDALIERVKATWADGAFLDGTVRIDLSDLRALISLASPSPAFEIGCRVRPKGGGDVEGELREFNADNTGALIAWNDGFEIWKALRNLEVIASPSPAQTETLECVNCGSREGMEAIKARGYISCCPERKMRLSPSRMPDRIVARRNPHSSRMIGHWRHDGIGPGDAPYLRATPELLALIEAAKDTQEAVKVWGMSNAIDAKYRLVSRAIAFARTQESGG